MSFLQPHINIKKVLSFNEIILLQHGKIPTFTYLLDIAVNTSQRVRIFPAQFQINQNAASTTKVQRQIT